MDVATPCEGYRNRESSHYVGFDTINGYESAHVKILLSTSESRQLSPAGAYVYTEFWILIWATAYQSDRYVYR